jgi:hypothetical protein
MPSRMHWSMAGYREGSVQKIGHSSPGFQSGDEWPTPRSAAVSRRQNAWEDTVHPINSLLFPAFSGVPRYGVPVGKSRNALWTRCRALVAVVHTELTTPHRAARTAQEARAQPATSSGRKRQRWMPSSRNPVRLSISRMHPGRVSTLPKDPAECPWLQAWGCKPGGPPGCWDARATTGPRGAGCSPVRQNTRVWSSRARARPSHTN